MPLSLTKAQSSFIQLLSRSPDTGDGCRNVSAALRPLAETSVKQEPTLYETEELEGVFRIRLTGKGQTLAEYL